MKIRYSDNHIRFFGRTLKIEGTKARFFNWSGSGFVFGFIGTKATARFLHGCSCDGLPKEEDRAYIGVFVDGELFETARFPIDRKDKEYTLAENLPFGKHTVYVVKETEMWYGRAGLCELSCDGEFTEPPPEKSLKIEFIGDSITCGYGNICSNKSTEFRTCEENFSNTYASIVSKLLDCEISVVAASGNGFFHDYGCNTVNLIPELYEYTEKVFSDNCGLIPEKWNFESDKCDAVVIKLGQNDAQYCMGADLPKEERTDTVIKERKKAFEAAAYTFFTNVINHRPDTPILFICEDDMYLKNECISALNRANGIEFLEFSGKREYEDVGANGHYSVYTHARVANLVAAKLKTML